MGKRDFQKEHTSDILKEMVIARLEKSGDVFEVLVKPDAVEEIRAGRDANISEDIAIDTIFRDVKKGTRASEEKMEEVFGTRDPIQIAMKIIRRGDIQITTEKRREMLENKKKAIITAIARNSINPQTGAPHPPQRIENAISEAKVHIDPFKSVDEQLKDVIHAIRPLIPINLEEARIVVKLSAEDCAKCYGDMKSFGEVVQEEWQEDGSWIGIVEMPAGLQTEFLEKLNEKTKGNIQTKILKKK